MTGAFLWGFVAAASLVVGGLIALWFDIGKRTLGAIMAFGAGVLISAVAYELVFEAIQISEMRGPPTVGFIAGALTFFVADWLIDRMGAANRKGIEATHQSSLVVPLVLGIILDGIPESVVIGLGILQGGAVSLGMLVAVFISNIPEAIAGTTGMRSGGWSGARILALWLFIAVVCAVASAGGYSLLSGVSPNWIAVVQTFAGGAILMMLANTMIPEAYQHGGKLAGIFTIMGFVVSVWIIVLEQSGTG